jgi:hypothetical protein
MSKIPKFKSIKEEREFWDSRSAFELLGEDNWEIVESGTTKVKSIYAAKVKKSGATLRLPKDWLSRIGAQNGQKIKVWTEGKRLIVELV